MRPVLGPIAIVGGLRENVMWGQCWGLLLLWKV